MRARSHSGRLRLWPFPLEMASVRARSHSERFNSLRLRPCDPARILGAEVACPLAFRARELSEVPSARARSHSGRGGAVRASPLAFWAREFSEVPSARARSLYGRRDGFRASPIAFCAREFFSASKCQQSLVSRKSFFPYSIPLLQDAKKYLLALGSSGGSPSSTNVMCLDVRGRDRWDWGGTKYHRKSNFPPQGRGGKWN